MHVRCMHVNVNGMSCVGRKINKNVMSCLSIFSFLKPVPELCRSVPCHVSQQAEQENIHTTQQASKQRKMRDRRMVGRQGGRWVVGWCRQTAEGKGAGRQSTLLPPQKPKAKKQVCGGHGVEGEGGREAWRVPCCYECC